METTSRKFEKLTSKDFWIKNSCFVILVLLVVLSGLLSEVFFTRQNVLNLLRQSVPLLVMSMGMLCVISTGGIDLATGSVMGLSNMIVAQMLAKWLGGSVGGLFLCIVIALILGILMGVFSGSLITFGKMAPFIVTLAISQIARGCAYLVTNGQPIRLDTKLPGVALLTAFGNQNIPGIDIPWPILLGVFMIVIFFFMMRYTAAGRIIMAVGSNEKAVRLAGISVVRYKMIAYCISGFASAMAGIIITSRASTGTPISGNGYELDAIAACVIGGASLSGGRGTVTNTVIGVFVLQLIKNTLNLMSVPSYPQEIIKGLVIIIAVLAQNQAARSE